MRKTFLRIGIILALLAVALGAFTSHVLKEYLTPESIATFETGVRYQFYHTLAIILVGVLLYVRKTSYLITSGWLFLGGIILFSGSLYLLSVQDWLGLPLSWVGPITPIGGILFIGGWALLFFSTFQENERYIKKREAS